MKSRSRRWKHGAVNILDSIIKYFYFFIFLLDSASQEFIIFLIQVLERGYKNIARGNAFECTSDQAGRRSSRERCGISVCVNLKLFIGFRFSVANNSSLWLKGETDITYADSNEKDNWLIAEKMWNYLRLPLLSGDKMQHLNVIRCSTQLTQNAWICKSVHACMHI